MVITCSSAADRDDVALVVDEGASGQFPHQGFVDGRICTIKVIDVFRQRQLGDGQLVTNGACFFFGDFRLQEVTDKARWFALLFYAVPMTGMCKAMRAADQARR